MNQADTELFEKIESAWVEYFSKCEARDEIPLCSDGLMSKMVTYQGDLPEGGEKPDLMPGIIDKYRKFYITEYEQYAAQLMFAIPKNLRIFVMLDPLIRNKANPKTGKKPSQTVIAATCGCTIDIYKKNRARAKEILVHLAKQSTVRTEVRKTVRTSQCVPLNQGAAVVISAETYFSMEIDNEQSS